MNYRKKVVLMLRVLSYLNLGTFSQAAPPDSGSYFRASVQQASMTRRIKISGSVRDAAGESIISATILEKRNFKRCRFPIWTVTFMTVAANGILHLI